MEFIDPSTGELRVRKRLHRYDVPGQPRELTFSCFHRFRFLDRDRTRQWFIEALENARSECPVEIWAYVIMPEHVHLIVRPLQEKAIARFLRMVKEPVARKAIAHLKEHAPSWLPRITVREGQRLRRRFWQPGGGYDRNIESLAALWAMIEYIHLNPVRRGLVQRPEEWEWSSARWFAGLWPVRLELDESVRIELADLS